MPSRTDSVARYRAAFAQRNLVQEIEALVARAWPPLTILDVDGWQLRSAGGLTLQANSVWPRAEGGRLSLDERVRQVEAFYLQGDTDPAVQISPGARPQGLEASLRQRGYRTGATVTIATRRVDLLADLCTARDVQAAGLTGAVELVDAGTWTAAWARAAGASAHHETMAARIVERVRPPAAYAVLADGSDVAVARGVADGGWLGLDLLAATGPLRTGAAGQALLGALGGWSVRHGTEHAYVAVDAADASAPALTAGAGLRRAYQHAFLVKPRQLVHARRPLA